MRPFLNRLRNVLSNPYRLKRSIVVRLAAIPFRLGLSRPWPGLYLAYVPDRYAVNLDKYQQRWAPGFFSKSTVGWLAGNRTNNGGDLGRFYFLNLVCDQILHEGLSGCIAELGVYRGNSAYLLAELARRLGTTAFLFDTFTGFDRRDLRGTDSTVLQNKDKDPAKRFADTSLDRVKGIVGTSNTVFVQGYFPESAAQMPSHDQHYVLGHIDCDLGAPFSAALEYFYPKLIPGGWIVMHDYSSLEWDGVTQAVDTFFSDKAEKPVLIPDKSGTVVIRKCAIRGTVPGDTADTQSGMPAPSTRQ